MLPEIMQQCCLNVVRLSPDDNNPNPGVPCRELLEKDITDWQSLGLISVLARIKGTDILGEGGGRTVKPSTKSLAGNHSAL